MTRGLKPTATVLTVLTTYALIVPLVSGIEDPSAQQVFSDWAYRLTVGALGLLAGLSWWLCWRTTQRGGTL